MYQHLNRVATVAALFFSLVNSALAQDAAAGNYYQLNELGLFDSPNLNASKPNTAEPGATLLPRDTGPALSPDFINFGYLQNNSVLPYLQYEALTHIAPLFVDFDANGNLTNSSAFTNRPSDLKLGGAADRAGTKIILCVRNAGFDDDVILPTVMQSSTLRANLVSQVAALVQNDSYCHGVNFDFEFSWSTATRNGITAFLQAMRTALPPPYEISVYTHAIYDGNKWSIAGIINNIDYMNYSAYDWGTGLTAHAISDFNNCEPHIASYMAAGVPPEKMVLTWSSYGRRWSGVTAYNQTGTNKLSQGFYNGLYDTTLRQTNGGPFNNNYVTGDETGWYTYTIGSSNYVTVWESPEALEYKISAALSFPGNSSGAYAGVRLRGVAWWSLMWTSDYFNGFNMYDPISNSEVGRAPYYRHIDLRVQELLKSPSQSRFTLESFENNNDHWRDPNQSPDTAGDTDSDSTFVHTTSPSGIGKPAGTVNAGRLIFDFENSSGNRAFLRHELLNNDIETNITDTNAALALVSKNTRIRGSYYVSGNYSPRQLRFALVDGQRELEVSDPVALPATAGWYTFQWDLNDPAQINAFNTTEPALRDGDGLVDTAGPDARDISFLGFMVEGGGAGNGTIYFDNLTYEDHSPQDKSYVVNEIRYNDNTAEFVEIAGPPGTVPADLTLVSYNSTNGNVYKSTSLSGIVIPASGLYVIGDTGVPNASGSTGFHPSSWTGDDIPNIAPSGIQLYGSSSGFVYDSVAYRAFGGLQDLARPQSRRVGREGYGWVGEVGPGLAGNGQSHSVGRMPDGVDTNVNEKDFSLMPPSPGQPNGASGLLESLMDFSSVPTQVFQTYQGLKLVNPSSAGIPASPGGGNVYRCVDTSGGGVQAYFGDALTGDERGLDITGQLYIPAGTHPAQAVAVGFCGTQGSTFFSSSAAGAGYEDGYYLIYENGTVGLNDGLSNHNGQFEFVQASNDNQDGVAAAALGTRKSLAQVSASAGTWITFHLRIDKTAAAGQQLVAQVNNVDVYRGSIPAGGRTSGAFTLGFRETDGTVAATEGTWVDNILIQSATPPASIQDYELY